MKTRFPDLEDSSMPFLKQDRDRFEAYLAHTHDLTVSEAREEFQAFLTRETEGRDAVSLRARLTARQTSEVTHRIVASSSLTDTTL
jgi:hypothetical protein